jgi:hypothetical protein
MERGRGRKRKKEIHHHLTNWVRSLWETLKQLDGVPALAMLLLHESSPSLRFTWCNLSDPRCCTHHPLSDSLASEFTNTE